VLKSEPKPKNPLLFVFKRQDMSDFIARENEKTTENSDIEEEPSFKEQPLCDSKVTLPVNTPNFGRSRSLISNVATLELVEKPSSS